MGDESKSGAGRGTAHARRHVEVRGVVQGVGFRPFVYRLAAEEALAGWIGNDTDGVTIEIEGPAAHVERFLLRLREEKPPLARIDAVAVSDAAPLGETGFRIILSEVHGQVSTGIPADAATCADCLRELFDAKDRRYRYPFLNCTNCGPRFTITRRIPYDRPQTSMAVFPMCADCQREYDDPLNRRFHAQPNACAVCGPRVWLERAADATEAAGGDDAVRLALECLAEGKIAAVELDPLARARIAQEVVQRRAEGRGRARARGEVAKIHGSYGLGGAGNLTWNRDLAKG